MQCILLCIAIAVKRLGTETWFVGVGEADGEAGDVAHDLGDVVCEVAQGLNTLRFELFGKQVRPIETACLAKWLPPVCSQL